MLHIFNPPQINSAMQGLIMKCNKCMKKRYYSKAWMTKIDSDLSTLQNKISGAGSSLYSAKETNCFKQEPALVFIMAHCLVSNEPMPKPVMSMIYETTSSTNNRPKWAKGMYFFLRRPDISSQENDLPVVLVKVKLAVPSHNKAQESMTEYLVQWNLYKATTKFCGLSRQVVSHDT